MYKDSKTAHLNSIEYRKQRSVLPISFLLAKLLYLSSPFLPYTLLQSSSPTPQNGALRSKMNVHYVKQNGEPIRTGSPFLLNIDRSKAVSLLVVYLLLIPIHLLKQSLGSLDLLLHVQKPLCQLCSLSYRITVCCTEFFHLTPHILLALVDRISNILCIQRQLCIVGTMFSYYFPKMVT